MVDTNQFSQSDENLYNQVNSYIQQMTCPYKVDVVDSVMASICKDTRGVANNQFRRHLFLSVAACFVILFMSAIFFFQSRSVNEPMISSMFAEVYGYNYADNGSTQSDLYQSFDYMYE